MRRRRFLAATAGFAATAIFRPAFAQAKRMRFVVGPLLPTPTDTERGSTAAMR
jgi:phosphonate transport system substrate-binding protein